MKKIIYLFILFVGFSGCSVDQFQEEEINAIDAKTNTKGQADKIEFGIPTLSQPELHENSLHLVITPGENGATGGFSVMWMMKDTFDEFGWNEDMACHAQLTANKNNDYGTAPGETYDFYLENHLEEEDLSECNQPLECGLTYVFIVRAHQDGQIGKSDYSSPLPFSTSACDIICPFGKGYWKNHSVDASNPGNQNDAWVGTGYDTEMMLGNHTYNRTELDLIMDMNNSKGNGLVILSQHLMAAKLNVAIGATMEGIEEVILAADELIGNYEIGTDSFSSDEKTASNEIKSALEEFNGMCDEE